MRDPHPSSLPGLATLAPSYFAVLIGYVFTAVRDRTVLR
jgi:hypothetical protein